MIRAEGAALEALVDGAAVCWLLVGDCVPAPLADPLAAVVPPGLAWAMPPARPTRTAAAIGAPTSRMVHLLFMTVPFVWVGFSGFTG